ncbi:MAG: glucose-6-phosphate dehydrogenase assembly protein OpcA [Candidatus Eremiobacteraeota bacterium]|nr:glucose-6-phosphate dehydrogenase assembly protein OpcA [Candidatus Eremiobacteraeota bacterium]
MANAEPPTLDLGAIDAQLKKARQESDGAVATTMNLMVYIEDDELHRRASDKAKALSNKYPARVMILHSGSEGAKVSTSVDKLGADGNVTAEFIELGIMHMSPQAICSAVNTLRVADTPNVLWWTSDTVANDTLFEDIIAMMDTVIVDSSGVDSSDLGIREFAEFRSGGRPLLVRDLAYMRLAPWQDMVAHFFDDRSFLEDLHRIIRVEITAGSSAEAYYLVAWMASRLRWKPCGRFALCDESGRSIEVAVKHEGDLRRVLRVALSTEDSTFSAELTDSPDTVCLSVTGAKSAPKRCSPLQHIDNLSLLEKAFLVPSRDEVFEESLRVLNELLQFKT